MALYRGKVKKVHYTIDPPCRCFKRWGSSQLTSTRNPNDVTCKNCLRAMKGKSRV